MLPGKIMSNAKKCYGRDILFFHGVNYEWDEAASGYIAMKGEQRFLQANELSDALRESGIHPDAVETEDDDFENDLFGRFEGV